ncbi:MAG: ABC transporter ATP-binding protein [Sedimentisphaerales bacterium]|nr:ABC transporter ATP-binding protein [Sedimentisphaerales bacterium]
MAVQARLQRKSMNSGGFVETEGLTKVYSSGKINVVAIEGVNLSVEEGKFLGVTGPSGSGKSTLMNLLGGLDTPSSGSIKVEGKLISELDKEELALYRRYQVGMIFQTFNIISSYTAIENVAFPLLFSGVPKKERKNRAAEMLNKVGLINRKDHRPAELSGGEQQRVAIARALVNQPKILLADEPTGNLDTNTSRQIMQTLVELNKSHGLTIIMISHEQSMLGEFADDVISLCDGKVIEQKEIR